MTASSPRTHHYLAQAYLYGGRPREALATALHVDTIIGGNHLLTLLTIAPAYEQIGEFEKAAAAWRELVSTEAANTWLNWGFLARAQARGGHPAEAQASAGQALNKAGSDARARAVAEKLSAAIDAGCYQSSQPDCDPLVGWQLQPISVAPQTP